ncbi:MAG: hypothetical protein QOF01_2814 [Thermomicrobiales bacterium]|jgi:hypothetical protein|nr:hypothetical protein [Thermomicrobiales bacterium]
MLPRIDVPQILAMMLLAALPMWALLVSVPWRFIRGLPDGSLKGERDGFA